MMTVLSKLSVLCSNFPFLEPLAHFKLHNPLIRIKPVLSLGTLEWLRNPFTRGF